MDASIIARLSATKPKPKPADEKPQCFGDLRRARIMASQTPPPPDTHLILAIENKLTETWEQRKARRAREAAGLPPKPKYAKPERCRGRPMSEAAKAKITRTAAERQRRLMGEKAWAERGPKMRMKRFQAKKRSTGRATSPR